MCFSLFAVLSGLAALVVVSALPIQLGLHVGNLVDVRDVVDNIE